MRHQKKRWQKQAPDFWELLRRQVWEEQEGRCFKCRRRLPLHMMHAAHLEPLGMGRSRNNPKSPANKRENVRGLDQTCHHWLDHLLLRSERELVIDQWVAHGFKPLPMDKPKWMTEESNDEEHD